MASSATVSPCSQVTPTAPYPVTGCGVLTTLAPPPATRRLVASSAPGAIRAPAGALSEYSLTTGSTTWSGTSAARPDART